MKAITFLKGIGLGAGLMYFYDPQLGRRRRKLAIDQFNHALRELSDAADVTWRDAQNRLQGCLAECRATLQQHDNSDQVVHDRVRAKLGRYVSHPSAIGVTVSEGHVAVSGPILSSEVEPLIECLRSVRGVRSVANRLDPHATPGNLSALQGGRRRSGEAFELWQQNWSPTTRCMLGSLGGALLLSAGNGRGMLSLVKGATAAWLISCAMQQPSRGNAGAGGMSRGGDHSATGKGKSTGTQAERGSTERGSAERAGSSEAGLQARSGPT